MANQKWLVQSCCDPGVTQIIISDTLLPGDVFKDLLGNCYLVLMATSGIPSPSIIIDGDTIYGSCEECGTCPSPTPSVTPSVTQTPAPTQTISPSVSVTPSPTTYIFVSKTPSVTPSPSLCACTYRNVFIEVDDVNNATKNTDTFLNGRVFIAYYDCNNNYVSTSYTASGSYSNSICWRVGTSEPTSFYYVENAPFSGKSTTTNTSNCCVPVSPTPTPSTSPISGSEVVIDDLCMDVVFGPAPSASVTPSVTPTVTPSVTVSPSSYPIYPSITPTSTPSVTPSVTPSKTPSASISSTPSVTPSITPTRTVTPSVSITSTPSISVSPSITPTPSPSPASGSLVISECDVMSVDIRGQVYSYNNTTNTFTPLFLSSGSQDIANTTTKLWLYNNLGIVEYDITLNSFTSTYNRTINLPIGTVLGAGMCAVDNTTLISSNVSTNQVIKITLNPSPDNTTIIENLFALPSGRKIAGDFIYTTDGKIILTTSSTSGPILSWISQYALIGNVWTLEFDLSITATAPRPLGLATINNGIYIFSQNNFKQISTTFPYTVTQTNTLTNSVLGTSQVPSCNNVTFQPNIIGVSPSPSPTPTNSVTPSITVSPSITPSKTPTPTPSPSAANNSCTGALPLPGNSFVYNGIIVTASGTGAINTLYPNYIASCAITSQINTINLGYPGPLLDFSYTLTFSQPVNNIKLLLTGIYGTDPFIEYFTFTTNIGTPTVLSNDSCYVSISGNTVTGTGVNGGGTFVISAPSPYTTLTVTGKGGGQGGSTPMSIDCNSISPLQSSCNSCDIQSLPVGGNGTIVSNNVTLTTTYSGPQIPTAILPNPTNMTCVGLASPSPFQTVTLGYNSGPFTYIINFSQPVNDVKFLLNGGGAITDPTLTETFTFNTNGGVPSLISCGPSCAATLNDNVLTLGYILPNGGAILTQVSALNNYTQLIITGDGGLLGTTFALCADTTIISPSTSPSPTPSITATPSKTPSVTTTPSVTPSITPSITPSTTVTPSVTPSKSPGFVADCNNIFYKTQTSQYYSYNFSTNTSTLLNVPVPPGNSTAVSLGYPVSSLTHTSNKLWSYTWNSSGSNNTHNIVEYNITTNPFTAAINRYIALPGGNLGTVGTYKPAQGLLAIDNTKLIGIIKAIGNQELKNVYAPNLPGTATPALLATNGMDVVEYDITTNLAAITLKGKLFPYEFPANGMLLTSNNKFIIITRAQDNNFYYITQYDYNTWKLEYRAPLTPTISSDCGLVELNGKIYIMGYNVYEFNPVSFGLTLVQSPQTQLLDSSQLINCINTSLPTSSCNDCSALPLKISEPMVYNGVTITPTYTGVVGNPTLFLSPGARDNLYPGEFFGCYSSNVVSHPSYSLWVGNTSPATPYTYSLEFSSPVNNVQILYNGTNGTAAAPTSTYEIFTWNTNGGTPTITLCNGCGQTINGNVISGSFGPETYPGVPQLPNQPKYTMGGGIITISAPSNYTTLTLTSPGGNAGTVFGICSSSVVPAPIPSPSPSATPSVTVTPTPTPSVSYNPNLLGCVYYSTAGASTFYYDVITNTSSPITLPGDNTNNKAETHTTTKYWKGNVDPVGNLDYINEWIVTNSPTTLSYNRTISVSDLPAPFSQFLWLQAVNDTTLLTTIPTLSPGNNPAGNFIFSLTRLDITTDTVTPSERVVLFNIYAPTGLDAILLTNTNKLITVGRRATPSTPYAYYLSQYSYPDGTLELDIDISSLFPYINTLYDFRLFESNGNLYVAVSSAYPTETIYNISLTSPYTFTSVWTTTNAFQWYASYNSSINCNTVNLVPPPSPSPTPSPSTPSAAFRTIYKYLDIQ